MISQRKVTGSRLWYVHLAEQFSCLIFSISIGYTTTVALYQTKLTLLNTEHCVGAYGGESMYILIFSFLLPILRRIYPEKVLLYIDTWVWNRESGESTCKIVIEKNACKCRLQFHYANFNVNRNEILVIFHY